MLKLLACKVTGCVVVFGLVFFVQYKEETIMKAVVDPEIYEELPHYPLRATAFVQRRDEYLQKKGGQGAHIDMPRSQEHLVSGVQEVLVRV